MTASPRTTPRLMDNDFFICVSPRLSRFVSFMLTQNEGVKRFGLVKLQSQILKWSRWRAACCGLWWLGLRLCGCRNAVGSVPAALRLPPKIFDSYRYAHHESKILPALAHQCFHRLAPTPSSQPPQPTTLDARQSFYLKKDCR